jgi:ribonuclease D
MNGSFPEDRKNTGKVINNKYIKNITAEELAAYELSWFRGEIKVIDNLKVFRKVVGQFPEHGLLGFDTETRPSFRKGRNNKVSLIQLATADQVFLFRVNKIGIPDELIQLLGNKEVIKAGVAIHDDIRFLRKLKRFTPEGFIDLQTMVKEYGIQCSGLKKLAAIVLGFRISKSQQVTDWEADELSEAQQIYAATDAWVCYEIYRKLNGKYTG